MPCLPGLTPVRSEVHAGGVIGGVVERSVPEAPSRMSRPMVGSRPSFPHFMSREMGALSRPTIMTFGVRLSFIKVFHSCSLGVALPSPPGGGITPKEDLSCDGKHTFQAFPLQQTR